MDRLRQIFAEGEKRARDKTMFDYFANPNLTLEQKLKAIVPFTHFIMAFRDFMTAIKQEDNDTDLQKLINIHSEEDSNHWIWYLNDIIKLNVGDINNKDSKYILSETWNDKYWPIKEASYTLFYYFYLYPKPSFVLLMVEALEISYVALADAVKPAVINAGQYEYLEFFGKTHYDAEAEHEIRNEDEEKLWSQIVDPLSDKELRQAEDMVTDLFQKLYDMHNALIS